jgi:uncharacterized glyoxalase superfamily protein PhnB
LAEGNQPMRLNTAAPTFAVADVAATMAWYETMLGFRGFPAPEQPPFVFASLVRDGVELMLMGIEGYRKPDTASLRPDGYWDAYIRMTDVERFYDEVRQRLPIRMPLTRQNYGDREFEITDPNGYVLVFSE